MLQFAQIAHSAQNAQFCRGICARLRLFVRVKAGAVLSSQMESVEFFHQLGLFISYQWSCYVILSHSENSTIIICLNFNQWKNTKYICHNYKFNTTRFHLCIALTFTIADIGCLIRIKPYIKPPELHTQGQR